MEGQNVTGVADASEAGIDVVVALVPLYRLQGHGDHFYTTSESERDNAISSYGYVSEGIACYVEDSPGSVAGNAEDDEKFWRDCFIAALNNSCGASGNVAKAAAIADKALLAYSDAIRRIRP